MMMVAMISCGGMILYLWREVMRTCFDRVNPCIALRLCARHFVFTSFVFGVS